MIGHSKMVQLLLFSGYVYMYKIVFKWLLWNCLTNFHQISCEAFFQREIKNMLRLLSSEILWVDWKHNNFFCHFSQGRQLCDFLFAFLHLKWSKFFPFKVDHFQKGPEFWWSCPHESIPILVFILAFKKITLLTYTVVTFQVVLAIPFLLSNPWGYIVMSFNFGRQFFYKWTVNWRLFSEDVFLNKYFQLALLLGHIIVLLGFIFIKWKR